MKRLFLAVPVPETIEDEMDRCRIGLPGARWSKSLHITLRFFGDISEEQQSVIEEMLAQIRQSPFELSLGFPGVFVYPRQTILYLKCIPSAPVHALKSEVDSVLGAHGFRSDRKFEAHCTLARLRDSRSRYMEEYLLEFEQFCTAPFRVDEMVLFSSILQKSGPRHEREHMYRLF